MEEADNPCYNSYLEQSSIMNDRYMEEEDEIHVAPNENSFDTEDISSSFLCGMNSNTQNNLQNAHEWNAGNNSIVNPSLSHHHTHG